MIFLEPMPTVYSGQVVPLPSNPPPWLVRCLKSCLIIIPMSFLFVMIPLVAVARNSRTQMHVTTTPANYEEYVERKALCTSDILRTMPNATANLTAFNIYNACVQYRKKQKDYYNRKHNKTNTFKYDYMIKGDKICNSDTELVLIIHAYQPFYDRRKAIRETWGGAILRNTWPHRTLHLKAKIVFIFGFQVNSYTNKLVRDEDRLYGDVVQGTFKDSYNNMTLKSLMGLKWVSDFCPGAKYLVKSDDDMIINFPYLEKVLLGTNLTWGIMGPLNTGARVYRKSSKWAISKELYPFYYYPPYESGATYVISGDLVKPLFTAAEYVPHIFIDDVFITGILGKILRVRHIRQEGFAYWVNKKPLVCDIINDKIITGTKMKPIAQYEMWREIRKNKCALKG